MDLISVFQNHCDASNLTFLLDSGSAVGAYRYHGFDPWDDYFDVNMRHEDRNAIANVLGNVLGHTLIKADTIWRFFRQRKFRLDTTALELAIHRYIFLQSKRNSF